MNQRPSWDETWMDVAVIASRRSTCGRASCGAVIVTLDNQLISTGYNGAPRHHDHCTEVGCYLVAGSCKRAIHAEMNAIYQAARVGASLNGSTLYCTHRPCIHCFPAIVQVGIQRVVYSQPYLTDGSFAFIQEQAARSGIKLQAYEGAND